MHVFCTTAAQLDKLRNGRLLGRASSLPPTPPTRKRMISKPDASTGRRHFLRCIAGTGLAGGAAAAGWNWWHHGLTNRVVSRNGIALGARVSMAAVHADRAVAEAALSAAFAELELVENLMSLYRPQSQLCRLNREGQIGNPHPYLVDVLRCAMEVARSSDGSFDVTVQPLWTLYHEAKTHGQLPDDAAIQAACKRVDWRRIEISPHQIILRGHGTAVTLNGIAQGFAADAALNVLKRHGVSDALIDTGEFGARGRNAEGTPWGIGIQHPRLEDALAAIVPLDNRCLATSGDYATTFSDDFTHNHLFNPRTGHSPKELCSVSVVAATAVMADALSTAVFVMGAKRGLEWLQTFENTEALLILKNGETLATPGFPALA